MLSVASGTAGNFENNEVLAGESRNDEKKKERSMMQNLWKKKTKQRKGERANAASRRAVIMADESHLTPGPSINIQRSGMPAGSRRRTIRRRTENKIVEVKTRPG